MAFIDNTWGWVGSEEKYRQSDVPTSMNCMDMEVTYPECVSSGFWMTTALTPAPWLKSTCIQFSVPCADPHHPPFSFLPDIIK